VAGTHKIAGLCANGHCSVIFEKVTGTFLTMPANAGEGRAYRAADSAMVKTFLWCSPLEKTKRRINTFEGEEKAARRNTQVDCSGLQNKQSPLAYA